MIKFDNRVFYAIAFLTCFNFLFAQQATIISTRPTIHQVNFDFVRNCCKQAQELRADLLDIIHDLYEDMDYWKMQKLTNLSYFISKGPTGWFSEKSQQQELNEKIAFLKQALELNAYYLGNIQHYLGKNYKEKAAEEIEQSMRELLMLIQQCVSRETAFNSQTHQNAEMQWAELLISNKRNLITFKKRMKTAYYGYKKPNHFRRNWLPYSVAAISALAVATYAYNNQEQIKLWHTNTCTALNNYYQTYMIDPIVNSVDSLILEPDPLATEDSVKVEEKTLGEMIQKKRDREHHDELNQGWFKWATRKVSDFFLQRSDPLSTRKPYSPEEIKKEKEVAIKKGDLSRTYEDIVIETQTTWQNLAHGTLIRDLLTIAQAEKVAYARFKLYASKTIQSNQLIIQLLSLFPTYILGKIIYNTSKSSLSYFNYKNNTPLKKNIRLIHRTLNKYTNASEISFTDQGLLVFWIHELKKRIQDVHLDDRYSFTEDLDDLLQQNFTVDQKKATIQQMYGTYNFLAPN